MWHLEVMLFGDSDNTGCVVSQTKMALESLQSSVYLGLFKQNDTNY